MSYLSSTRSYLYMLLSYVRFFENINPSFPIIDEMAFKHLHDTDREMLPSALLCNIYAVSLIYWPRSAATSSHPCPNIRYAWNLASKSLSEDYYCPGISTILAS